MAEFEFDARVWLYEGDAAWHFVTVPADVSDAIDARTTELRRGFGSVRVHVTIGATTWSTSVFPDRTRGAFILPIKAEVRRREGLGEGSAAAVALDLADV